MDELTAIQDWYLEQCNGDWEHQSGVHIETLDNPGWTVRIDLADTVLEGATFPPIKDFAPDRDWIKCWVEGTEFHGVGGPLMLRPILRHFLQWAHSASRTAPQN